MTTTHSTHSFSIGDYVKTSKGNIGIITSTEKRCIKPNLVKLGNKEFEIWSDRLSKLDKLTIRTQQGFSQHNTTLPVEDAKLLMEIYQRNNIWFAIV